MRQLSGHDAGFLYSDTAHSNANVSLLHIYDQSTAPGGVVRFKSILAHIERRLHAAPLLRQRLQQVPLGLDHPYWVDDENFDLEYHVRHIALPKPGDWRQFCIQASRIHARALDLGRPLWEVYVIEGLDSFLDLPVGSFALLLKTHLAAVDLAQASELTTLMHDVSAAPPSEGPPEPWFADSAPSPLSLLAQGAARSATAPLRLARPLVRAATHLAPAAAALASEMILRPKNLPVTRFNAVVSPHRVFETRRFTDAEFAAICTLVDGASVEDAVLAVCAGALRRYLDAQGELPEGHSLAAIVPVARSGETSAADAALAWRHVALGTDIADPVQRLAAVHAQRQAAPDVVSRVLGSRELSEAAEQASAATLAWTRRMVGRAGARVGRRTPPANCTVTPVPAPAQPQFLCGARMTYYSAILPISDGLGLAFAVTRYDGQVVISPTSCRELMPDPEAFALCLRDSFQEYLALARRKPSSEQGPARARRLAGKPRAARPAGVKAASPRASVPGRPRRPSRPA
jgi:WS/DGAT/MGAT family acyltransferase